ncbi:Coiled-coil domain-containing protein [Fasciolopsis buskii]|uniref:Coiled-coil domain-containing protein n=1 Tax=Fasciolopsis buskii TaxID=27845 RepID=A0A8E0S0R5_9TREM|nr:Coiled-coil domain-containing protein [Fasciolopsis buski]
MNNSNEGHLARLGIDMSNLESEMNVAVARDTRYWMENDAKIRAVEQRVPTYEHFRQLVAGCHLCPIDKSELKDLTHLKSNWNSAVTGKLQARSVAVSTGPESMANQFCKTPQQLYARWQALRLSKNSENERSMRLCYLVFTQQSSVLRDLFDCGLGAALLPEILSTFNAVIESQKPEKPLDAQLVTGILSTLLAFTESKQFPLAVDLCSFAEKEMALSLLNRLSAKSNDETVCSLKSYFVSL